MDGQAPAKEDFLASNEDLRDLLEVIARVHIPVTLAEHDAKSIRAQHERCHSHGDDGQRSSLRKPTRRCNHSVTGKHTGRHKTSPR